MCYFTYNPPPPAHEWTNWMERVSALWQATENLTEWGWNKEGFKGWSLITRVKAAGDNQREWEWGGDEAWAETRLKHCETFRLLNLCLLLQFRLCPSDMKSVHEWNLQKLLIYDAAPHCSQFLMVLEELDQILTPLWPSVKVRLNIIYVQWYLFCIVI